jgi:hypothetical protein
MSVIQRDVFKGGSDVVLAGTEVSVGPFDLLRFQVKTFTVRNGGAGALTAGKVQAQSKSLTAPDNEWEDVDIATFATLGAGVIKSVNFANDARQYFRVRLNGTGPVSVSVTGI